jgi:hypothetical protein
VGDQHFPGTHQHKHDYDYDQTGINSLFQGRGPGRILILTGMIVAGFGIIGWASMIFGFFNFAPGRAPEARRRPCCHVGSGASIRYSGSSCLLPRSWCRRHHDENRVFNGESGHNGAGTLGHLFATVVIIAVAVFALAIVLAGALIETLMPHFAH